MKAWLKGGLIVGFLYAIISLFIIINTINHGLAGLLAIAATFPSSYLTGRIIGLIFHDIGLTIVYIYWAFNIIFFFLIGSLIGLIFKKLEIQFNRKNIIIRIIIAIVFSVLAYLGLSILF